MKKVQKEFDFLKTLEDTSKALEMDAVKIMAKKEMLGEIIEYIKQNEIKFTKAEEVEEESKSKKGE